jgi:outer membrane immunogenic protein
MKKALLSTVALLGLTSGVLAADLPNRAVAPTLAAPVAQNWGFFITPQISTLGAGIEAGYRWDMFALRATSRQATCVTTATARFSPSD